MPGGFYPKIQFDLREESTFTDIRTMTPSTSAILLATIQAQSRCLGFGERWRLEATGWGTLSVEGLRPRSSSQSSHRRLRAMRICYGSPHVKAALTAEKLRQLVLSLVVIVVCPRVITAGVSRIV